eukprot:490630_1
MACLVFIIMYTQNNDIKHVKKPVLVITILGSIIDICLTFSVVGIIDQNNVINSISHIYESKCYSNLIALDIHDLGSQIESVITFDVTEGVVDIVSLLILFVGRWGSQLMDSEMFGTCTEGIHAFMFGFFDLVIISMNAGIYVLPLYNTFESYNNGHYLCYKEKYEYQLTQHATAQPTLKPTIITTTPTIITTAPTIITKAPTSRRCKNYASYLSRYIREAKLLPVGRCYYYTSDCLYGKGLVCESDQNGSVKVVPYIFNNCLCDSSDNSKIIDNGYLEYPDVWECEIGGDASGCDLFEETRYQTVEDDDKVHDRTGEPLVVDCVESDFWTRTYVTNMCIANATSSWSFDCGESGYEHVMSKYDDRNCSIHSDSFVESPSQYWCEESTCNGHNSPRADSNVHSMFIATIVVLLILLAR